MPPLAAVKSSSAQIVETLTAGRGRGSRVERVVVVHGLGRLAGMDADRLARAQQVAGLQQRIDELQHGGVLGGALEYGPAPDKGVDALGPFPFEVVASLNAEIEVRLQCCAQGLDLGSTQQVPENHETLLVVAAEVVIGGGHEPGLPRAGGATT